MREFIDIVGGNAVGTGGDRGAVDIELCLAVYKNERVGKLTAGNVLYALDFFERADIGIGESDGRLNADIA